MVLADAKDVQADLVSALNALEQLAQSNFRAGGEAGVVERGSETIDSDLHLSIQTYLLNQASNFDIVNRSRAAPIPLTTSKGGDVDLAVQAFRDLQPLPILHGRGSVATIESD